MGPLFFRAENNKIFRELGRQLLASMGPLFFRAENSVPWLTWCAAPSLQWGRSFSERRTQPGSNQDSVGLAASMGPLFFRAENKHSKP